MGDDRTYGKGSYQEFTHNARDMSNFNEMGENKVTQGRYYTVSGNSPQLTGVKSNIVVPGQYSQFDIGEEFAMYPLATDSIEPFFDDDLRDIPTIKRMYLKRAYKFDMQPVLVTYAPYMEKLRENSAYRIAEDLEYQHFLKLLSAKDDGDEETIDSTVITSDVQLRETINIMKDLILMENQAEIPGR